MRHLSRPLVIPPDAVLVATHYLRPLLAARAPGVEVSGDLPPGRSPVRHVRIRRTGGTLVGPVEDRPRLDFQVWDLAQRPRADLAGLIRGLIWQAPNAIVTGAGLDVPVTIGQVAEFAGPNVLPDPRSGLDSSQGITQFTMEMRLRGAAAV